MSPMKTGSMRRLLLSIAAALVLAVPSQSAWAWDVDESDVEGALVSGDEDEGGNGSDSEEGSGEDGRESVSSHRTSFAASDDEDDARPARRSRPSDDEDAGEDAARSRGRDDDGDAPDDAKSKGRAADDGDDGDGDDGEGRKARTPKKPAVEEEDEDDASLYPANHPKRRRQAMEDDGDDGDGWVGFGQSRASREDDRGDEGSTDSRNGAGSMDEGQDYEPWFGESFFNAHHIGLSAELALGGYFRQGSMGGLEGKFGLGLSVAWNMGRLFFDRGTFLNKGLWLELSWLHPFSASGEEGTDMVKVTQSQHDLSLAAIVGYPVWRLLIYGKVGPSMYVGSLDYDVGGSTASWSMVRGGLVYGVGVHSMFFVCDPVAISARVELLGHRRSYYNDLQLTLKLGVAF